MPRLLTLLMDGMPHGYCLLWNPRCSGCMRPPIR